MKDAMAAIENDNNVAILGIRIRKHLGRETVVFLHRAKGEKRLSFSKRKFHASSRRWCEMNPDCDPDWAAFKQMVGRETKVVIYSRKNSNNLLSYCKY